MADRQFHSDQTQGVRHINLRFTVLPNGTGTPTIGEGDANQSFVSLARTGVGAYTITSKDPYVAIVSGSVQSMLAVPTGLNTFDFGPPTQDSTTKVWSIPLAIFTSGVAADIAANADNRLLITLVMRNSSVKP